jgi:hypothetical protein
MFYSLSFIYDRNIFSVRFNFEKNRKIQIKENYKIINLFIIKNILSNYSLNLII